jgi:DNA-directed RNA polymerase subunit RPC12/RpoP
MFVGSVLMSSYMCPDCGERVDEENTVNDKCNYCHHGKYAYGDI